MARRQKGPTPEELIQKLQECLDQYKESNDGQLETLKSEQEESLGKINGSIGKIEQNIQNLTEQFEAKNMLHTNKFENIEECFSTNEAQLSEHDTKLKNNEETILELKKTEEEQSEALDVRFKESDEKLEVFLNEIKEEFKQKIDDVKEKMENEKNERIAQNNEISSGIVQLGENLKKEMTDMFNELVSKMESESKSSESTKEVIDVEIVSFKEQVDALIARVDDINEKMYEFEQNKKNNLLFYGIPNDPRESPEILEQKILTIMKTNLGLRRDVTICKASRLLVGPEISGSRPVVVTFENHKDKEEVLRKAGLLRGSNIHITEDMNRRTRESRSELRKFVRVIKKNNPAANCSLHYDKLYVDNKMFVYNDQQGKVVEQNAGQEGEGGVFCRSVSVMGRSPSPVWNRGSKNGGLNRSQSVYSNGTNGSAEDADSIIKEKEDTIMDLKNTIRKMEEDMERLREDKQTNGTHMNGDTNGHSIEMI